MEKTATIEAAQVEYFQYLCYGNGYGHILTAAGERIYIAAIGHVQAEDRGGENPWLGEKKTLDFEPMPKEKVFFIRELDAKGRVRARKWATETEVKIAARVANDRQVAEFKRKEAKKAAAQKSAAETVFGAELVVRFPQLALIAAHLNLPVENFKLVENSVQPGLLIAPLPPAPRGVNVIWIALNGDARVVNGQTLTKACEEAKIDATVCEFLKIVTGQPAFATSPIRQLFHYAPTFA